MRSPRFAQQRATWPAAVAAVAAVLVPISAAHADDTPLTLAAAQRLALEASPTAGIARARLDKAEAARTAAWSALFPSVTLSGTYTRRGADAVLRNGAVQSANALRADLSIDLTLFDARALALLSASAEARDAQAMESEELRRALSFAVAGAYYAVLSADSLAAAAERRRVAAETTAREAASRFEAGLAARNDVTRTELERAVAHQELSTAKAVVSRARLGLAALIGFDALGERPLEEPPPSVTPTAGELEADALAGRRDVAALELRAAQLDTLASEPLLRLVPTLSLRGLLFATNEENSVGRQIDGSVAATLTWRIFDGGLRYADHAARLADHAEALERVEDGRIQVRREVRAAKISVDEARATLELAEVRARVAEQNADEVRTLFASGLVGALEQVDAAVAEYEARASLVRQKVSVRVAELGLLAALGSWPGERIEE